MPSTRDEMTISQWLALAPTTEEVMNDQYERTQEENEAHKALILGLFEGVEKMKLATLITDAVGALYTVEPRYACVVLKYLQEEITRDYALSLIPEGLAGLIIKVLGDD